MAKRRLKPWRNRWHIKAAAKSLAKSSLAASGSESAICKWRSLGKKRRKKSALAK